jgi:hypothetical protein
MRIVVISTLIILSALSPIFCQQEIGLDKATKDSTRVKGLHGFDVGYINALNTKYIFNKNPDNLPIIERNELQLNYWHELGLGARSSLILKAGANFARYYYLLTMYYTYYMGTQGSHYEDYYTFSVYRISTGLHFTIEPRWYFDFKKSFHVNRALTNQGWYLSLPVEIVGATEYTTIDSHFSKIFNVHNYITPTIGYRKNVYKHILIEGSIGYLMDPFTKYNSAHPSVATSIKIAYVF